MSAARIPFAPALLVLALFAAPARAQLHAAIDHEGEERDAPTKNAADTADGDTAPAANGHVPPPPPQHAMGEMSDQQMIDIMGMNDDALFSRLMIDRLERLHGDDGSATAWSASAWVGYDFDKLWLKSEGRNAGGRTEDADIEAAWSHAIAPFWDTQLGLRRDFGDGPGRTWAAFGVQGLAPYWFEFAATAYVGDGGRTALRVESEYELRFSQRLILEPRLEANVYGKADPARGLGAGLSDAEFGLRLRYEIRREFAPYLGIEWHKRFGASARFARAEGGSAFEPEFVVGFRILL